MQLKNWLLLPFLISPMVMAITPLSAQEIQKFGQDAPQGRDGVRGQDGQNSSNTAVFLDGSPTNINLSGQDGSPGGSGQTGADAMCELQPLDVSHNLVGANGGDGGDGGTGGNGGNGGNITVYTTNPAYLQQLSILTPGGRGGDPGEGGTGGQGCQCQQPFWTVPSCTGRPGQPGFNCTSVEFSCQDGKTGKPGRNGNAGRDGRPGSLTLINSDRPVNEDRAAATVSFTELKDRGFTLSRNRWETRTGAAELLAPGSIIADQYIELVERIEKSVLLVWNAPQSFAPFANQLATLELLDNQEIEIIVPNDVWLEYAISENNNLTEMVVINAILRPQVLELEATGISGNRENLLLTVVDNAQLSDLVGTEFAIIYRTVLGDIDNNRRNRNYRTRFEGDIPPELINYQNNQFVISVGELPIDPGFLAPGTAIEIDLIVTRTFQDNLAVQQLRITQVISR